MVDIYDSDGYEPKIVSDATSFFFNSVSLASPRVNIMNLNPTSGRDGEHYKIPGTDGSITTGSSKIPLTLSMDLEISSTDLEIFMDRKQELMDILEGGTADNKFDFYLRYLDTNNYIMYPDCTLKSMSFPFGRQDVKNTQDGLYLGTVEFHCDKGEPSIKIGGAFESGDVTVTEDSTTYIGAVTMLISDELIVQNSSGDVKLRFDASVPQFDIVGTLTVT